MSEKEKIKILMLDGCTESEAKKHIKNGCLIFSDLEQNFNLYVGEWGLDADEIATYRKMIDQKIPAHDWGIVQDNNKYFYIQYVL